MSLRPGHINLAARWIAARNIGCITQIASGTHRPLVDTVELLNWAGRGPKPAALK